jgi:Phosphoinositide 3-kinase C2
MAPKAGSLPMGGGGFVADPTKEKWVSVTWMPHTALSQTSHVCLTVRSAHAVLDGFDYYPDTAVLPEWRVRIGVYGIAGLPLVPLQSHSTSAPVTKGRVAPSPRVTVSKATHDCVWDCFVHIPIRWRDLPRDAYLHFQVVGQADAVVYQTTMPFFSQYGKLVTGLQKLALSSSPLDPTRNHGLVSVGTRESNDDDEDDPVWKAVATLDQLERMEERARSNPAASDTFGQVPSVPWLDAMLKERAQKVIADAIADGTVRWIFCFVLADVILLASGRSTHYYVLFHSFERTLFYWTIRERPSL